jgi:hypothetical protein
VRRRVLRAKIHRVVADFSHLAEMQMHFGAG